MPSSAVLTLQDREKESGEQGASYTHIHDGEWTEYLGSDGLNRKTEVTLS